MTRASEEPPVSRAPSKRLGEMFIPFPFAAALLVVTTMGLVTLLTPGGARQTLGFNLQQEAQPSDVIHHVVCRLKSGERGC